MASYSLHSQFITRSKGHSATGAAAYRSGEKIRDETNRKTHDYTGRSGVTHTEIFAPDHAPEWVMDRARLWNEVEKAETNKDGSIRKTAQLAQEVRIALPRELTHDQNKALVEEYVTEQFVSKGMVADVAFHESDASDGGKNPHAHILLTMRDISIDGFGNKNRDWNDGRAGMRKKQLEVTRESWANVQNDHLEKAGSFERVSHLSHKERGFVAVPTIHLGKEATALEKKGEESRRGNKNREIEEQNQQTKEAEQEVTKEPERSNIFEKLSGRRSVVEEATKQRGIFDVLDEELEKELDEPEM